MTTRMIGAVLLGLLWMMAGIVPAQAGTKHYYYTDAQGTVLAKADAQGNIVASYDYAPYGTQVLGTSLSGPTGYTGHVNDAESGFVYMQQRYYDPGVGRFLSVDPVIPDAGDHSIEKFNRFAYAINNPVRYTDPDGRCPWCIGAAGGAIAGAAIGASASYVASGGNWRAAFAGGVGGAVGGAITGGSLGAGSSLGATVALGITAGIAGETTSQTVSNLQAHGTDYKDYEYSGGKIAVSGALGAVGTANATLVREVSGTLSAVQKSALTQGVVVPAQLVSDQIADNPARVLEIDNSKTKLESSSPL